MCGAPATVTLAPGGPSTSFQVALLAPVAGECYTVTVTNNSMVTLDFQVFRPGDSTNRHGVLGVGAGQTATFEFSYASYTPGTEQFQARTLAGNGFFANFDVTIRDSLGNCATAFVLSP